ncbi:hypothetical protein B484DRAFT_101827 [Ochromonadaceae sp. CCMP2298]|nr:hypothetical protein B484DRAFT_101827 [Ochromonadaceae sp. CCMP2298]
MSGADLRKAALENDSAGLKDAIVKMCNPCSCDEYGLSPLHYAVWNGHTECVKLLVCNARGVDARGIRCKSLELLSCMGYTALHLAALDCPAQSAYEVAALLLVGGSDHSAKSGDGRR